MTTALEQLAGKRVLLLNWRDLTNPAAGGAEAYTEQIARRFAAAGASVTLFTSAYRGSEPDDSSGGYRVIRRGGRFGVYPAAALHLRRHARQYDAVVDFQNGIPFFAPRWAPPAMPVVCVVHHVHQRQFDLYFPWPVNHLGRLLEGSVSRRVYGGRPMVAVSPSTRAEMRRQLGFRGPVYIVPNGVDVPPPSTRPGARARSAAPSIAVVTRLVPHKQIDRLVAAVPELRRRWPGLRVTIAGTGPGREALTDQVRRLALEGAVSLPGRVSDEAKTELLSRAWLTVAPSVAEGWGLTVIEANAVGTPAVAYDVPGLRDSVRDGVTGWLVRPGESLGAALARAIEQLADPRRRQQVAARAKEWAASFSWDSSAERLADVLLTEIWHRELGSPGRRRPVDLATVAWWPPELSAELAPLLRKALRITDLVVSDDDGLKALLIGCDELGAARALQRVPVPPARLRLATTSGVLAGRAGNLR